MQIKSFRKINPVIIEKIVPIIRAGIFVINVTSFNSNKVAPNIAGINIRNEKLIISFLLIPCIKPEEIVAPDLETPGSIAKA